MKISNKINQKGTNKFLVFIIFAVLLSEMFLFSACKEESLEIELDKGQIKSIEFYNVGTMDKDFYGCITVENNKDEIEEFSGLYNKSKRYTDDAGTTHLKNAEVVLDDGTTISIWYGTQGFITVGCGETQINIKNRRLEKKMDRLIESDVLQHTLQEFSSTGKTIP